ncbi:MAG: YfcE family phosphodiesterase [Rhodospirillales bacterium]|nr:YfcE family phosphodiesterase [Rhodospirillales bacterium]
MRGRDIIVGLISDTHGLLRPQAVALLRGSDFIIHAGDVGDPRILLELAALAPVTAVRGNVDIGDWATALPEAAVLMVGQATICVIHRIDDLALDPAAAGFHAVVYGHSHRPGRHERAGVLYVNPGSAGPRRFSLPIGLGRLIVTGATVSVDLIEIAP